MFTMKIQDGNWKRRISLTLLLKATIKMRLLIEVIWPNARSARSVFKETELFNGFVSAGSASPVSQSYTTLLMYRSSTQVRGLMCEEEASLWPDSSCGRAPPAKPRSEVFFWIGTCFQWESKHKSTAKSRIKQSSIIVSWCELNSFSFKPGFRGVNTEPADGWYQVHFLLTVRT